MEISKTSWHYRIVRLLVEKPRNDLCGYFWQVVFVVAVAILIVFAAVGAAWSTLCIFLGIFFDNLTTTGAVAGSFWVIGLFVILVDRLKMHAREKERAYYRMHRRYPKTRSEKRAERRAERGPNIFWEWIKAKKRKICPRIEFK